MQTISLLGCGSLGFPLALRLLQKGYYVKGSTTTLSKLQQLKKTGINPYLINIDKVISADFFEADVLVLTLPYKKSFLDPNIYKNQIKIICDGISISSIKHIVFTSSSSVYPNARTRYLASDKFEPTNLRAKVLLKCEEMLNGLENISVIAIRLGGINSDRRLIKKSPTPRRLVAHKDALELVENSIYRIGENYCINGFKYFN